MKKVVIIGGGVSGVYLSILLKQKLSSQLDITILEQNQTPLKKLLATGNGRCNLSHSPITINQYQSDHQELVNDIVSHFDMEKAMNDLGILTIRQGELIYPKSEQALTIKNILLNTALQLNVHFVYECQVTKINHQKTYHISSTKGTYDADMLICATGSEAGKLSGVGMQRYEMLKQLQLQVIPSFPSLVQMRTKPAFKQLKGVRVKGTFRLLENGKCVHKEKGELLFTDYGVSGIAVMQLSAFYQPHHDYEISIDFFDEEDSSKLYEFLELRMQKGYNHFYDGMVHYKLAQYFESLHLHSTSDIVKLLKDMRLQVIGLNHFETAQVMKGGLSLKEVNQDLEIKKYPHMYAVGEILNVAGMCGGYNLHFAFASALRVGQAIERECHVKNS